VDWSKISNRIHVWDYSTNYGHFVAPFPNWYVLGPNIRFLVAHGVRGLMEEGNYRSPGGDMTELKQYLIGRLMWDPTVSDREVIAEFLAAYYGPAASFVKIYMDTMHTSVLETGSLVPAIFELDQAFLTPAALLASAHAFRQARKTLGNATSHQKYVERVDRSKLSVYFALLMKWDDVKNMVADARWEWPIEKTKEEAFDEFARIYNATGITIMEEGLNNEYDLATFRAAVFAKSSSSYRGSSQTRLNSTKSSPLAPLPPGAVRDFVLEEKSRKGKQQ